MENIRKIPTKSAKKRKMIVIQNQNLDNLKSLIVGHLYIEWRLNSNKSRNTVSKFKDISVVIFKYVIFH